jgi:hypothetical protein
MESHIPTHSWPRTTTTALIRSAVRAPNSKADSQGRKRGARHTLADDSDRSTARPKRIQVATLEKLGLSSPLPRLWDAAVPSSLLSLRRANDEDPSTGLTVCDVSFTSQQPAVITYCRQARSGRLGQHHRAGGVMPSKDAIQ